MKSQNHEIIFVSFWQSLSLSLDYLVCVIGYTRFHLVEGF